MAGENEYAFAKLKKALSKLKEGVDQAGDELERDGVIQRFEFTFELLWKTLGVFLKNKGILSKAPKDILKEAFRLGWLKDEEAFLSMLEDRNRTSHIYEEKKSREIFDRIKKNHLRHLEELLPELEKILKAG